MSDFLKLWGVLRRAGGTAAALGALVGRPAAAQTTFNACYVASVGALYIVTTTPAVCRAPAPAHVLITWTDGTIADNAVTSAKIADGSVGSADLATGAVTASKLASGVLGWEMITNSLDVAANTTASVSASCPTGKEVLGGGFDVGVYLTIVLTARPSPGLPPPFVLPARFTMTARTGGVGDTFTVYAICANT